MYCFFSSNELQPRNFAEVFRKFEVTYLALCKNCRSTHNKSSRNSFYMEIKLYILNKRELKLPIVKKNRSYFNVVVSDGKNSYSFFSIFLFIFTVKPLSRHRRNFKIEPVIQRIVCYIEVLWCQGVRVSVCQGVRVWCNQP